MQSAWGLASSGRSSLLARGGFGYTAKVARLVAVRQTVWAPRSAQQIDRFCTEGFENLRTRGKTKDLSPQRQGRVWPRPQASHLGAWFMIIRAKYTRASEHGVELKPLLLGAGFIRLNSLFRSLMFVCNVNWSRTFFLPLKMNGCLP